MGVRWGNFMLRSKVQCFRIPTFSSLVIHEPFMSLQIPVFVNRLLTDMPTDRAQFHPSAARLHSS
jgi:hypothetical protein